MEGGGSVSEVQTTKKEMNSDGRPESQTQEEAFGNGNDEGDYCRICRGEATDELPLFYPCKCSGSIKFVHQDCLMEWLSHSQKKYCELCKTPFRFTKLYDHRMPQTLPLPVFIRQLCIHAVRNTLTWIRYLLVGIVWLGWLPWSIRQVWRGLFWLADGSWAAVARSADGVNSTESANPLANSTQSSSTAARTPLNTAEDIVNALPQMAAPIAGFLGYPSSEFLLVKIARFLYPNLFRWSTSFISTGLSNGTAYSSTSIRQPSFLSELRYLKTLTNFPAINNSIIDVLEGQLICLLIVTAFILIFLIREWVINQQPAPDIPDPHPAEQPRPAAVEEGQNRGPARRRRRAVDEGREERVRRIGVPRPRRRIAPANAPAEEANPATAATGQLPISENPTIDRAAESDPGHPQSLPQEHGNHPEGTTTTRPSLQGRNALEDATSIRRTIEEGNASRTNPEWPGLETFKDLWNRAESDPAKVLRIIRDENRQEELGWVVTQMERLQRRRDQVSQPRTDQFPPGVRNQMNFRAQQNTDPTDRISLPLQRSGPSLESISSTGATHGSDSHDEVSLSDCKNAAESSMPPTEDHPDAENGSSGSWDIVDPAVTHPEPLPEGEPINRAQNPLPAPISDASLPSPPAPETSSDEQFPELEEEATSGSPAVEASEPVLPSHTANSDPPRSIFEALADWLWRTEDYVARTVDQPGQDDEQVVEDVNQEAPFVPVPPADDVSDTEDEADAGEAPNPEVVAAAAAAGIDLNNPEAIEDAEDLDGILELIGMQGPMTGMIQNVIFSEFLITLTLAASVWLPYIWGKIALLLLANPVGVFVRAPLHLLSNIADTSVDIALFVSSICVYVLNLGVDSIFMLASFVHPMSLQWLNTHSIARMSLTLASGSGARLERTIFGTVGGLRPDLPTFSVLSHQALRVFQKRLSTDLESAGQFLVYLCQEAPSRLHECIRGKSTTAPIFSETRCFITSSYRQLVNNFDTIHHGLRNLRSLKIGVDAPLDTRTLDYGLVRWNAQDRTIAIILGYAFFALVGYMYIKISRLVLGLKNGEKVEGVVADSLRQAGGVMKVILIIGIEMIVFPLYCGLLLDIALMPLFHGVGLQSRLAFLIEAPMTALFVHWFVGTCYMFHFALFVSMCRGILRRGVLYFIRDPDDPTFHPVRDVLERPIATQLSKIAFSGLVYGGLVILCLGGIVWVVSQVGGIFPIQWTSNEPILEFPIDLLFYNFMLPILIRKVEPSKKLNIMYGWWFRKCARWLRLSHFLFHQNMADEQGTHIRRTWLAVLLRKQGDVEKPVIGEDRRILAEDRQLETYFYRDGTFVRGPGSDSVRIPKGGRVFLEVDENNNRTDGLEDKDDGPHGKKNESFVHVYIPPMFRARIAGFVALVWAFAAVTGIVFTIMPLLLGRKTIHLITQSSRPSNDLYAFSAGLYLCVTLVYAVTYCRLCKEWISNKTKPFLQDTKQLLPRIWSSFVYCLGLAYMGIMFGVILPFLFSAVIEVYFIAPLYTLLMSKTTTPILPPTIYVVQTWTVGLFNLRTVLRVATNLPNPDTRAATAIRAILRHGFLHPDVRLATRAFILPSLLVTFTLLLAPTLLGSAINIALQEPAIREKVYRYSFPGVLGVALALYCAVLLKRQFGVWRTRIRDDVYLIGERLHNFGEAQRRQDKGKGKARARDRAVSERLQIQ
jgi:E3 ubiquitin-protein ligase MARCH6